MEVRYMIPTDDRMTISNVYQESWKTLVCVDNGKIVGTSSFCKSRFKQFQGWGEIISIYLLPDHIVMEEFLWKLFFRN